MVAVTFDDPAHRGDSLDDTLLRLAKDADASIRTGVARIPNAPPRILDTLASDSASAVREAVASNLSTPPAALHRLSKQPGYRIRARVAANPSARPDTLASLASSPNASVRSAVATNPSADPEIRDRLLQQQAGSASPIQVPDLAAAHLIAAVQNGEGYAAEAAIPDLMYLWGIGLWVPSGADTELLRSASPAGGRLAAALSDVVDPSGQAVTDLLLSMWRPRSPEYARLVAQLAAHAAASWPLPDAPTCSEPTRVVVGASREAHDLTAAAAHPDRWIRAGAALHPQPGAALPILCADPDQLVAGLASDVFAKALLQGGLRL